MGNNSHLCIDTCVVKAMMSKPGWNCGGQINEEDLSNTAYFRSHCKLLHSQRSQSTYLKSKGRNLLQYIQAADLQIYCNDVEKCLQINK